MALQLHFTSKYGFDAPEAYARICSWSCTRTSANLEVQVFKDKDARFTGVPALERFSVSVPCTNGGSLAELYSLLKKDSNFVDAIDTIN